MLKKISKYVLSLFMIVAGMLHFINPQFYLQMMPPYLPCHLLLVYLSGFFEVILGILLLFPVLTTFSACGIIALMVAVFPANIYLYQHQEILPAPPIVHFLRLPLQGVFIMWAYWHTRKNNAAAS